MTVRNCKEYEHVCSCENLDRLTEEKTFIQILRGTKTNNNQYQH